MSSQALTIRYHPSFSSEKEYILRVLFQEFLEIPVQFEHHDADWYEIVIPSGQSLLIRDAFFARIEHESYLHASYLPAPPEGSTQFPEDDFHTICLFGKPGVSMLADGNQLNENDYIAASFLMLSRWDESLSHEAADEYGRFPESSQISVKYDFFHRPVVNEWLDAIKQQLVQKGFECPATQRAYSVFPEHDIDIAERFPDMLAWFKSLAADIIHFRPGDAFRNTWQTGYQKFFKKASDPFETYEYLMNQSERFGLQSRFYWMPGQGINTDVYPFQGRRLQNYLEQIQERGHAVGMHPGFNTFWDDSLFAIEYERFTRTFPEVTTLRRHFLQFKVPYTFRQTEKFGFNLDTSFGFKDRNGFRCGVCYSYPMFDVLEKRTMNLWVSPFLLMDVSLLRLKYDERKARQEFESLAAQVRKYQGDFRFIWHNNSFEVQEWKDLSAGYPAYLQVIAP